MPNMDPKKCPMPVQDPEVRNKNFSEVALGYTPEMAVNEAKRRRIVRTAALYLAENRLDDAPVRFDIVEVLPGELRHLRAAFDATDVSEF